MTKRVTELLILGGFMVLAFLLYRSTAAYPDSVQGSTAMYIRFLAVSLGLLCAVETGLWLKSREKEISEKLNITAAPMRFWGLFIELVIYSLLLEPLGFYLASVLFLPVAMVTQGAKKPITIGLTTAGVLLFVFLVFEKLLVVPLPERLWF
ncbi:tripartite tricarboxylate transporter TctB family protein [Desulfoluna sp.]|uniref:tripartite tricarboxylate transporter TctB family protein n=1 Tax=Desulfoluna sp. TaxID=2045199 RepID=UPI00262B8A34|nr:tripartite tricarboxylate transporter TctB family protein [Desulfoluna sp.]